MRWKTKARIMQLCAAIPGGPKAYRWGQQQLGRAKPNPMPRLPNAILMAEWLRHGLGTLQDSTLFEVGTGHLASLPIFLSLLGARRVYTVDLYRRMDDQFLGQAFRVLSHRADEVRQAISPVTDDHALMERRLALLQRGAHRPLDTLAAIGVEYLAPADASAMALPDACVDGHFSARVMEHIPADVIGAVFREARRLIRPGGVAVHFVDPSDHFAHHDTSITCIDFLRYTPEEWARWGGNQFAYCNRLRKSDLARMMIGAGFTLERESGRVEPRARQALADGFRVHQDFLTYDPNDLCAVDVRLLLRRH